MISSDTRLVIRKIINENKTILEQFISNELHVEISRYTTGKITCSQVTALNAPSYDKSFVTGHSYNLNVCFYVPW